MFLHFLKGLLNVIFRGSCQPLKLLSKQKKKHRKKYPKFNTFPDGETTIIIIIIFIHCLKKILKNQLQKISKNPSSLLDSLVSHNGERYDIVIDTSENQIKPYKIKFGG